MYKLEFFEEWGGGEFFVLLIVFSLVSLLIFDSLSLEGMKCFILRRINLKGNIASCLHGKCHCTNFENHFISLF